MLCCHELKSKNITFFWIYIYLYIHIVYKNANLEIQGNSRKYRNLRYSRTEYSRTCLIEVRLILNDFNAKQDELYTIIRFLTFYDLQTESRLIRINTCIDFIAILFKEKYIVKEEFSFQSNTVFFQWQYFHITTVSKHSNLPVLKDRLPRIK